MANENDRKDALRGSEPSRGLLGAGPWNREDNWSAGNRGEGPAPSTLPGKVAPARGESGTGSTYGGEGYQGEERGESRETSRQSPGDFSTSDAEPPRRKQRRGFAAMDPTKQREIASKGGKASHEQGTGHEWNSEAAREAGRKGGQASRGGRGKIPTEGSGT